MLGNRRIALDWTLIAAPLMDLGLGLSLGMYYTVTYFGRVLAPLPGIAALAAPVQYYLLVGQIQDTGVQAWLWMACFPFVGTLWRVCLWATGRLLGVPISLTRITRSLWYCNLVLLVPAPIVGWLLASTDGGASWDAFIDACLRRRFSVGSGWLIPTYLIAAVVALGLELRAIWRLAPSLPGARRVLWIGLGLLLLAVLTCALGLLAQDAGA